MENNAEYRDSETDGNERVTVEGDLKMAWLWVEGWRARLRMAGDLVEKERWEWDWQRKSLYPTGRIAENRRSMN